MPWVSSVPSQSTLPIVQFFFLFITSRISFVMASTVFSVVSISHTFSFFCSCSASVRHVSRISAARFSLSLASG